MRTPTFLLQTELEARKREPYTTPQGMVYDYISGRLVKPEERISYHCPQCGHFGCLLDCQLAPWNWDKALSDSRFIYTLRYYRWKRSIGCHTFVDPLEIHFSVAFGNREGRY